MREITGLFGLAALLSACGGTEGDLLPTGQGGPGPFASEVVRFEPGEGAGHGQDSLPDVVLGAPSGFASTSPSLEVLSLGQGGVIELGFEGVIFDEPGPDFVVFENPFYVRGDPARPYAELAEVSVSSDGQAFTSFVCDPNGAGDGTYPGCAGWTPTKVYDPTEGDLDPELTGGDAFDLSELGVDEVRMIRIRDLSTSGEGPSAGFDLDGVGAVHLR